MTRQPTVSSESVAQDQIRAFVERILRMKEEAKAIKDDIREIYAEAKGNGFDKTVLGQVVSYVEKRGKDANELLEREALFELYMAAFDGTAFDEDGETGTPVALTHTHENTAAADPGIESDNASALDAGNQSTGNVGGSAGRSHSSVHLPTGSPASVPVDTHSAAPRQDSGSVIAPEAEVARPAASATHPVANVGEEAIGPRAAATIDPASREVDDADRQRLAASGFSGERPGEAEQLASPATSTFDTVSPAATNVMQLKPRPPRRPLCQRPDACASMSANHCFGCTQLIEQGLAVEPGGVEIKHQGSIGA